MTVLSRHDMSAAELRAEVAKISGTAKKARKNGKQARKAPEELLQESVCEHLAVLERTGRLLWFHVPNAGKHHISFRMKMKRLGLRAGVPDLVILPKHGNALFIELKSEKGVIEESQEMWIGWLSQFGYAVAVCRSLDEVQAFLRRCGIGVAA